MSDAKTTIKHAILAAMAEREVSSEEEAADAIVECVFAVPIRWAVVKYLEELS